MSKYIKNIQNKIIWAFLQTSSKQGQCGYLPLVIKEEELNAIADVQPFKWSLDLGQFNPRALQWSNLEITVKNHIGNKELIMIQTVSILKLLHFKITSPINLIMKSSMVLETKKINSTKHNIPDITTNVFKDYGKYFLKYEILKLLWTRLQTVHYIGARYPSLLVILITLQPRNLVIGIPHMRSIMKMYSTYLHF